MKKSSSDLLAYCGQSDERYIPLEYIESTGTQWIDTGIYVNQDTDVEIDYQYTEFNNSYSIFGCNPLIAFTANSLQQMIFRYSNVACGSTISPIIRAIRRLVGNKAYVNGDLIYTFDQVSFQATKTALLFARSVNTNNNIEEKSKSRLFSCKIRDGSGTLIRDFVPMMRVPSNIPGLYDRVEGRFYESMGTGQFVAGPALVPTDYSFRVSLDTWTGSADTGETFSGTGSPIPTAYMSKPCCRVDNGVKVSAYHLFKYAGTGTPQMTKPYLGCFTCWVASVQPLVMWSGTPLTGIAVQNSVTSITNYVGLGWSNSQTALNIGAWSGTGKTGDLANNDTAWHFMAVNMTVDTGWQFKPYTVYPFIDGVMYDEKTITLNNVEMNRFFINNSNSKSFSFYLRDIRVYDRHLTEEELNALYVQGR